MGKRGPKYKVIDWEQFDKLCYMQCTLKEIAAWFDMSEDSIEIKVQKEKKEKFSDYWVKRACRGRISLRRAQWKLVDQGDRTMIIFLSKAILGMRESVEVVTTGAGEYIPDVYIRPDSMKL